MQLHLSLFVSHLKRLDLFIPMIITCYHDLSVHDFTAATQSTLQQNGGTDKKSLRGMQAMPNWWQWHVTGTPCWQAV